MAKVIYIAGYGRSGSTVLDIVLGNHSQITGVGEATYLLHDWANGGQFCSCGTAYSGCAFWKELFSDLSVMSDAGRVVRKVEKLSFIPRLLMGFVSRRDREIYRSFQAKLFDHVVARSGKPMVVDSSKSARQAVGRFLALKKLAGHDVYVLHLVRSGLATMESALVEGSNRAIEGYWAAPKLPALRAAYGWVSANLWAALLGRLVGPDRYRRFFYEDFVRDPATALREMGRFCGFEAEELIERIKCNESFAVGHLIGGNRVRLQGEIRIQKGGARRQGDRLKRRHRLMFTFMGGWLHRHYGYSEK